MKSSQNSQVRLITKKGPYSKSTYKAITTFDGFVTTEFTHKTFLSTFKIPRTWTKRMADTYLPDNNK